MIDDGINIIEEWYKLWSLHSTSHRRQFK